jgi:hypothetical protein
MEFEAESRNPLCLVSEYAALDDPWVTSHYHYQADKSDACC